MRSSPEHIDPEFEARLRFHQGIVDEGQRRVNRPVMLILAGGAFAALAVVWLLPDREAWWGMVFLWGGVVAGWLVHSILVKRWYRWAVAQDVDLELLHDLGVEAKLMWRPDSFFGRREAPQWKQLADAVRNRFPSAR